MRMQRMANEIELILLQLKFLRLHLPRSAPVFEKILLTDQARKFEHF